MSSEISAAIRRAEQLRARLEEDRHVAAPGRVERVWSALVDTLVLVTFLVLAADAVIAYRTFQ